MHWNKNIGYFSILRKNFENFMTSNSNTLKEQLGMSTFQEESWILISIFYYIKSNQLNLESAFFPL